MQERRKSGNSAEVGTDFCAAQPQAQSRDNSEGPQQQQQDGVNGSAAEAPPGMMTLVTLHIWKQSRNCAKMQLLTGSPVIVI